MIDMFDFAKKMLGLENLEAKKLREIPLFGITKAALQLIVSYQQHHSKKQLEFY